MYYDIYISHNKGESYYMTFVNPNNAKIEASIPLNKEQLKRLKYNIDGLIERSEK